MLKSKSFHARCLSAALAVRRSTFRLTPCSAARLAAARAVLRSYWRGGERWRLVRHNGIVWRESYSIRTTGAANALALLGAVGAGLLLAAAIAL